MKKYFLAFVIILALGFGAYLDYYFPAQLSVDKVPLQYVLLIDNKDWQREDFPLTLKLAGTWSEDKVFAQRLGITLEKNVTIESWYLGFWIFKGEVVSVQYSLRENYVEIRVRETPGGYQGGRVEIGRLQLRNGQALAVRFINEEEKILQEERYVFQDNKVEI